MHLPARRAVLAVRKVNRSSPSAFVIVFLRPALDRAQLLLFILSREAPDTGSVHSSTLALPIRHLLSNYLALFLSSGI